MGKGKNQEHNKGNIALQESESLIEKNFREEMPRKKLASWKTLIPATCILGGVVTALCLIVGIAQGQSYLIGASLLLGAFLCLLYAYCKGQINRKEFKSYEFISVMLAIAGLIFVLLSMQITKESLDLTRGEVAKSIELDENIRTSLFQSLNIKLDLCFDLSAIFLDRIEHLDVNNPYLIWDTSFPENFVDDYVSQLRITDHNTVAELIFVQENAKRINRAIEQYHAELLQSWSQGPTVAYNNLFWLKEQETMRIILKRSCRAKYLLAKDHNFPFNQPDLTLITDQNGTPVASPDWNCDKAQGL
ncbi:MAG: hypothetical protein NT067_00490 [Candidatus Diapherotrites archaeon]|nr:hypothetical protein [Candidatus Diapherotrites archaeon]